MTTTLRCWEIGAGIPMDDGRLLDCSQPEVIGDERYHATREAAEEYAQGCRDLLPDTELDPRTEYHVTEVTLHDYAAVAVARRWSDEQREAAGWAHCESGKWSEVRCESYTPTSEAIEVAWVPSANRETVDRCGSWRGLSTRLTVCPACAEYMQEIDGDYVRVVARKEG